MHDENPLDSYRDARYWDPQFAVSNDQFEVLRRNYGRSNYEGELYDDVDLKAVGSTTLFLIPPNGTEHRTRAGNIITLGELIAALGDRYTAMELMCWWWHAPRLTGRKKNIRMGVKLGKRLQKTGIKLMGMDGSACRW